MKNKSKFKLNTYIAISIFFIVTLILPMTFLLKNIFYQGNSFVGFSSVKSYICNPYLYKTLKNSIEVATIASISSIILSFLFCYGIERTNIKFKRIFSVIVQLPILTPSIALGLSIIYIFGGNGILSKIFPMDLYGKTGIIIGESIYTFPISFLIFQVAFKTINNKFYEVSEVLGITSLKQFIIITLSNLKLSIIIAFITSFVTIISDFGIPKIIGGNFNVMAMDIYKYVTGQNNLNLGAISSVVLLVPSIICFIIKGKLQSRCVEAQIENYRVFIKENKIRDIVFYIYNILICLFMVTLYVVMVISTLVEKWPYNLNLTFKWFYSNDFENIGGTIFNSIIVAGLTCIIGTIIAFFTAYLVEDKCHVNSKINKIIKILATSSISIPGLSIGIAFILFFNSNCNPLNFLYGTYMILVLVNIIHLFSIPFLLICENIRKVDKKYKEVAEVFNMCEKDFIKKIVMPICKSSLIESLSYFFINSINSTSAVIFLYTYNTKLLSVEIINMYDTNYIYSACALCVIIVCVNVIFKAICSFIMKR